MVVPSLLVVDSPVMTNHVRCGETSSMVTGTQQVMCSPSQPCHQGCRGESVVSEIIFNQNPPGDNCSSTLPQDSNSSGRQQYIEQFYVKDGPLQEQESTEAPQGLTYWDSWPSQI
ncbi:uncharacterized protein [Dysidea avara]|uniref:uncharacterized protein isoform X1 n=1 Tax=Dysidea avara TaxID=196820 RepID=UPI00332DB1F3